ncbi:glutathione S-transferase Mu 3-like protein [Obelidium mucronatum]|nr:glutathione S-transferase Mu 3-like protein [Obelidium mucronatum]
MPAILGYWNIRGLAAPIRYVLEYTKTPYEDRVYTQGDDLSRAEWTDVKPSMTDLAFPNLPYFLDGDLKITQSGAIMRYIAEKHNLAGSTPSERATIDMIANEIIDMRSRFTSMCYNKDFENLKPIHIKNTPASLERLEKFYGSPKTWITGDKICYADFMLYELICQNLAIEPAMFSNCPRLLKLHKQIEELDCMKEYINSPAYNRPFNNKSATFGGRLL